MPPITEGQLFPTLNHFKEALREWAVEENFTPHILDSDKQRVRAGCRSGPDCPFRIRVNYNIKLHAARVTTVTDTHTCAPSTDGRLRLQVKRSEIAKLGFLIKIVPELLGEVKKETSINSIIEAVENKYGQRLLHRQAQKVKQVLCQKPCRHCHQFGHSSKNCSERPAGLDADQDNAGNSSCSEERPRRKSRCLVCFQTGHNRKNCPQKGNNEAQNQDAAMIQSQLTASAYAPNLPPNQRFEGTFALAPVIEDEPNSTNHDEPATDATQHLNVPRGPFPPNRAIDIPPRRLNQGNARQQGPSPQPRPSPQLTNSQQPELTPQPTIPPNARQEAARLMQQAAKLMQEAARLNFEAARLTASVPD